MCAASDICLCLQRDYAGAGGVGVPGADSAPPGAFCWAVVQRAAQHPRRCGEGACLFRPLRPPAGQPRGDPLSFTERVTVAGALHLLYVPETLTSGPPPSLT